jgi:hypothetical protein
MAKKNSIFNLKKGEQRLIIDLSQVAAIGQLKEDKNGYFFEVAFIGGKSLLKVYVEYIAIELIKFGEIDLESSLYCHNINTADYYDLLNAYLEFKK